MRLGHTMSISFTTFDGPKPKCTRGSLEQA
jgi:hypothetical protein